MVRLIMSCASVRLIGDEVDPRDISRQLGQKKSDGVRKGEIVQRPRGKTKVAEIGVWRHGVEDRKPGDLDSQIGELFGGLSGDLAVWRDLAGRFHGEVFCGLFMSGFNNEVELSPATLEAISARGLTLRLDMYDDGGLRSRWKDGEFVGNGSDYD